MESLWIICVFNTTTEGNDVNFELYCVEYLHRSTKVNNVRAQETGYSFVLVP